MNIDEDTLQESAEPATKRAAKKTTAKKAAAKKAPAKKAAAKKTTRKKAESEAELPLSASVAEISAPESSEEAPAAKKRSVRKTAKKISASDDESAPAAEAPAPAAEPSAVPDVSEFKPTRQLGRVPGGGRVVSKKSETSETPHQPSSATAPTNEGQRFSQNREDRDPENRESRSKRRREKRKRKREQIRQENGGQLPERHHEQRREQRSQHRDQREPRPPQEPRQPQLNGPKIECDGMLEIAPKGFGFLRVQHKNFDQARDDVFVTPESIRRFHLRVGQWIHGTYQEGPRGPQLVGITSINGQTVEEASKLPHFDELKAINPSKRISFETSPDRYTTRVLDIMAPVGRGQRGLIVSPPRSGKTTLLLHMAQAVREKYEEQIHLMIVLIDERPEEVTEFRRALPGVEIYASSNDEQARSHCRIAELAIERAKRLVEAGKDVFLLMDSITRLARAYNGGMNHRGRGVGSGGITIGALEVPRRLFAAARNTRGGGSLTILATALVQTNSRADEAIFMEFKGTGNMELVLDRKIAENYIYPAVDIFKSGTRREELLLPDHMLHKIHLIRRGLSGHRPVEAMERLLFFQKKFPNNPQMLLEIKG
ncbi:MAG: transcription termination factor Rho [Luteolibacter sp.]